MENKRIQNLTFKKVKQIDKKFDEMDEMILEIDGKEYRIKFYKHFRETKIAEVIKRFLIAYSKLKDIKGPNNLLPSFYANFLVIKEFTSLGNDLPDDLESQLDAIDVLLDLDIFFKIIGALPQEELNKVNDRIGSLIIELTDNYELMQKAIDELADKGELENEDVFYAVMKRFEELADEKYGKIVEDKLKELEEQQEQKENE